MIDHVQRGRDEEARMTLVGRGVYDAVPWELWALLEEDFLSVRFRSREGGGGSGGPLPQDAIEAHWFGRTGNGWRIIMGTVTKEASTVYATRTDGERMNADVIHVERFPFNLFLLLGSTSEAAARITAEDVDGNAVAYCGDLWDGLPDVGCMR